MVTELFEQDELGLILMLLKVGPTSLSVSDQSGFISCS